MLIFLPKKFKKPFYCKKGVDICITGDIMFFEKNAAQKQFYISAKQPKGCDAKLGV